ncbi:hypothetical protein [Bradyrhizobium neotropicale]|uniref:hypothetical protein n=1 Tax=Bradyrhizobium neotropicale TaxID=1497615 RepID=UPI003907FC14
MVSFDEKFRRQLQKVFVWRGDVRRFRTDPLPPDIMERLIKTACLSPSVGLPTLDMFDVARARREHWARLRINPQPNPHPRDSRRAGVLAIDQLPLRGVPRGRVR